VGKWNGPGGKFDGKVDKNVEDTAIRECQEEVGLTPKNILLRFIFFKLKTQEEEGVR
jgi:8-oxo-dGTP pyrophosphatase MutT (NUDIX family)